MGVIVSYFGTNKGRTDDPDPVTGLTSHDKYLLTNSWSRVRANCTKNGVALLLLFFERYPEDKNYFPFRDISNKELEHDKKFHAHCNSVMYSVSSMVDSLDDSELLVQIIQKVGDSHNRRNIAAKAFWDLNEVMLELFSKIMSKEEVEAWKKALEVIFTTLVKGFKN